MRFNALPLLVGLMGCPGGHETDSNDSGTPDDAVTYNVTINWSIDGVVQDDPVPVSLHNTDGETGDEELLITADHSDAIAETGEAIPVQVPKAGQMTRAWLGPATADTTSDGHRILEYTYDGTNRQWVHPLADFLVEEDCEDTVSVNRYFNGLFACRNDTFWYDESDPEYKGEYVYTDEGEHLLEVTAGKEIVDPDDRGLDEFLPTGCSLESSGSGFAIVGETCQLWLIRSSWKGSDFTILAASSNGTTREYACTLVE